MKEQIWILFSVANEYNQPDKAFEKLFWIKPTEKELIRFIDKYLINDLLNGCEVRCNDKDYWIESFMKPKTK